MRVPYRSGAEVVFAVMRGEVDIAITTVSSAMPYIRSGDVRAIGVGGEPSAFGAFIAAEIGRWSKVIQVAGIQAR